LRGAQHPSASQQGAHKVDDFHGFLLARKYSAWADQVDDRARVEAYQNKTAYGCGGGWMDADRRGGALFSRSSTIHSHSLMRIRFVRSMPLSRDISSRNRTILSGSERTIRLSFIEASFQRYTLFHVHKRYTEESNYVSFVHLMLTLRVIPA
jgi:hypothetical protein